VLVRRSATPEQPASTSDVIETSLKLTFPTKPCACGLCRGWTLYEVNLGVDSNGHAIATQCIWECEACKCVRATGALMEGKTT
jgi:hypothetical protein